MACLGGFRAVIARLFQCHARNIRDTPKDVKRLLILTRSINFKKFFICLCFLIAFFSQNARAGVWLQTAFTARQRADNFQGVLQNEVRWFSAATVGFAFRQGFLLGMEALGSRGSLTGDHSLAWGPVGGFLLKGFELTAGYLPVAKDRRLGNTREGGGFAINAGYLAHVVGPLRIGFQVTYLSILYDTLDGQVIAPKQRSSFLSPQLSFALGF
jgi:hypothetical protein